MSETRVVRAKLVKIMAPYNAVPIENKVGVGTPDINYRGGWIECKYRPAWPKSDLRIVTLPHPIQTSQRIWRNTRVRKGGTVILALRVANDWFFFTKRIAWEKVGGWTKSELYENADFIVERIWDEETKSIFLQWVGSISKG